jgi:hypothetical protein
MEIPMQPILINRFQITGRFPDKAGEEPKPQIIPAGTHITDALVKKFGLHKDDQLKTLIDRGHIVERNAFVVSEGDGPSAAELAAAEKRATEAEGKLADETKRATDAEGKLADETKRATDAEGKVEALTTEVAEARKLLTPEQIKTLDAAIKPKA